MLPRRQRAGRTDGRACLTKALLAPTLPWKAEMKSRPTRRSAQPAKPRPVRSAALPRKVPSLLSRAAGLWPLAGFLLACLLPGVLPADWLHSRLWKGYYTVYLPSPPPAWNSASDPAAPPGSVGPLVSRQRATVSFNTFDGLASIRVAELPARLDSADPRQDPFLRSVDAYFRRPPGEWVYVRTRRGPLAAGLGRLGPGRQVLELDPVAALIRLLLLAGASLLVLLPARVPNVPRWLLGLGLLPWALGVGTGDLRDLLAFLLLYPFWVRAMVWAAARQPVAARSASPKARPAGKGRKKSKQGSGRRGKPRRAAKAAWRPSWLSAALEPAVKAVAAAKPALAALALLGAVVFLLAAPGARHLLGALIALAADLCLLAMLPAARRWERSQRAHPLFRALPILGTLRKRAGRRRQRLSVPALAVPAALALLALASAAALSLEARRRDLSAPRLEPSSGARGLSWETLAALPLSSDPLAPPHLGDYLAHMAYQQNLAFQRPYRFPAPGERVYVSTYAEAGAGYVQGRRVARRFAESWLPRTLAAAPPGSVERMLVDQGRAAAVRRVGEPQLLRELAPWPRAAAVALFLLACLTAAILSDTRTFAL